MRAFGVLTVLGVSAALVACETPGRREAESVAIAVERFRQADNARKPELADALRATTCSVADVCAARDACLASAEPTARALRLKVEVEGALGEVTSGRLPRDSARAQELTAKLDEASGLLKEGFEALGTCDERILAIKRTYRF